MGYCLIVIALLFGGCNRCDDPSNKCKSFDYVERNLDESIRLDTIPYELYEKYEKELYREHNITEEN